MILLRQRTTLSVSRLHKPRIQALLEQTQAVATVPTKSNKGIIEHIFHHCSPSFLMSLPSREGRLSFTTSHKSAFPQLDERQFCVMHFVNHYQPAYDGLALSKTCLGGLTIMWPILHPFQLFGMLTMTRPKQVEPPHRHQFCQLIQSIFQCHRQAIMLTTQLNIVRIMILTLQYLIVRQSRRILVQDHVPSQGELSKLGQSIQFRQYFSLNRSALFHRVMDLVGIRVQRVTVTLFLNLGSRYPPMIHLKDCSTRHTGNA